MINELPRQFLEEVFKDSGEDLNSFEKQAGEIKSSFEYARYDKYAKVISHLKNLRNEQKISPDLFRRIFSQTITASKKEFGQPLKILELEKLMDFIKEYDEQIETLKKLEILQHLPESGRLGIVGINDREYPLPTIAEISEKLSKEKIELLKRKQNQGFVRLLLVPFAAELGKMIQIYERELGSRQLEGKLKSDEGDPIELGEFGLISIDDAYKDADRKKEGLIYYPKKLDKKEHGGGKKLALLEKGDLPGWRVCLVEDTINVPGYNEGATIGGRKQPEYLNASDYLELIQSSPEYKGEDSFTIDDWIWLALSKLQNENILIDQGRSHCSNVGSIFLPRKGVVLSTCCSLSEKFPTYLSAWQSPDGIGGLGFRSSVKIN